MREGKAGHLYTSSTAATNMIDGDGNLVTTPRNSRPSSERIVSTSLESSLKQAIYLMKSGRGLRSSRNLSRSRTNTGTGLGRVGRVLVLHLNYVT